MQSCRHREAEWWTPNSVNNLVNSLWMLFIRLFRERRVHRTLRNRTKDSSWGWLGMAFGACAINLKVPSGKCFEVQVKSNWFWGVVFWAPDHFWRRLETSWSTENSEIALSTLSSWIILWRQILLSYLAPLWGQEEMGGQEGFSHLLDLLS